jgi:polyisoprenoid-binding protein YceI
MMRSRSSVRWAVLAAILGIASTVPSWALAAESYKVDRDHSIVLFSIEHLGLSHVHGRFNETSGSIVVDDANPAKSSVDIEVKADSLDTNAPKRDAHLKSPDFFNVKQFPTIAFKSKSVKKSGDEEFEVAGDLTVHGVTKPVTVKVSHIGSGADPWGGQRSGFETTFKIKRSDYDMKYMIGAGLGDEVEITVAIEGVRQDAKKQ